MSTIRAVASLLACALLLGGCGEKQGQFTYTLDEGKPKDAPQAQARAESAPATPTAAPAAAPTAAPTATKAAGAVPPSGDPQARSDPKFYLPADSELTTTASGLKYMVLREGSGTPPKPTSTFTAHYCGWYPNGEVFDSTYPRNEPLTYPVGRMIPGWKEALVMMKPGSEYILVVSPELGYGVGGGNGIPPNSTLVFRMELLSTSG